MAGAVPRVQARKHILWHTPSFSGKPIVQAIVLVFMSLAESCGMCLLLCMLDMLQEKRKRDAGQQSRGKSTVEEEKRIARQYGVYSGFD